MSKLKVTTAEWKSWKGEGQTLVVFAFQGQPFLGVQTPELAALAKADGFKGKDRETILLRPAGAKPAERVLVIGLGEKKNFNTEVLRKAVSRILQAGEQLDLVRVAVRVAGFGSSAVSLGDLQAIAEGLWLAAYKFDRHLTVREDAPKAVSEVVLYLNNRSAAATKAIERGEIFSDATTLARDLINEPPSRMNPEALAAEAKKLHGSAIKVKVYEVPELKKLGMGGIVGVGAGGAVPPRLVELIYKPSGKAKKVIALVGKGITFDSGGLSLKPAQGMETMKDDMSGAAAVIGIMTAVAALKPKVEVRGYLAIAENMPGGRAQKPGDVLKAYNGKTIEVLNTDAEGRLVLSDALSYASAQKPDIIIDIATLTGAAVVALGHLVSGVMTNDSKLARALIAAGEKAGEKFWELPLVSEYKKDIKSKIADLKNIGGRRGEAGTIIGGLFLQEFAGDQPWAHIDIAGPSWTDSDQPYCPTGGTGHPVRTILHYLETF